MCIKAVVTDPAYFVRENCAAALARVARPVAYAALVKAAATDPDHRVRIAAMRALPAQFSVEGAQVVESSLLGALPQESLTAAEWLLKLPADSSRAKGNLLPLARRVRHWRARAVVLQAALRQANTTQRPALADTIRRRYGHTVNHYEKAALLTALSEDPAQFDFLAQAAAGSAAPIVPGTALIALVSMHGNKNFPVSRQADFMAVLRRALAGGDVAQLSTAAEALASLALPTSQPEDLIALRQAQAKLALPREIEAWLALQQALDKLTKVSQPTPAPVGPASQHPIDWALVQSIPVGQRVRFTTSKGVIVLELKVVAAPGSVASFVSLVR